jgi:hypothetical protein
MLSNLIKIEYDDQFEVFIKSLMKRLSKIEDQRNRVVHWIVMGGTPGGEQFDAGRDIALHQHPNMFGPDKMRKAEVKAFIAKTAFLKDLIFNFDMYLKHGSAIFSDPALTTWTQIFQRPVDYLLPNDHPLSRFHKAQLDQPQS